MMSEDTPDNEVQHIDPLPEIVDSTESLEDSTPSAVDDNPVIDDNNFEAPVETPAPEENKTENTDNKEKTYKTHKVTYQYSVKPGKWDQDAVTISLPSNLEKQTKEILDKIPNIDLSGSEEVSNWGDTLSEGIDNIPSFGQYVDTLNNPDSEFRQSVDYKGSQLGINELKTNFNSNHLTGEKAILAFSKALGVGDLVQVPLWSSGIWVTLKTPSEADMIRLNQEIIDDKINQGRATKGLLFSNSMVYTIDRLSKFAIDHIFDTTLQSSALENKDIRDIIKCQDYPTLVWGLICSMYPRGFQFRRACINDPEKCNYVLEEVLNPKKLLWVNYRALTETHMVHMGQRQHKIKTLESVLNYQQTLATISDKVITIGNDAEIKVTLKSPSMNEYVTAGEEWINGIVKIIDTIVSKGPADNNSAEQISNRNRLIERYSQSSSLRQISHWIKIIEMNDYVVDDTDTLANILTIMSQDDSKRTELIEKVSSYIEESTLSVIGVPVYDCPKCKMTQAIENDNSEFKNIIPLDVTSIFFDQHVQRMMKIGQR
jgi:hypothetical protein